MKEEVEEEEEVEVEGRRLIYAVFRFYRNARLAKGKFCC